MRGSMRVVKKYAIKEEPLTIEKLSADKTNLLTGKGGETQLLLKSLYGNWVVCSCEVPVTIKRFITSNTFFLATVKGRGRHKSSCPLFKIFSESSESNESPTKIANSYSFSVSANEAGGSKVSPSITGVSESVGKEDKLYTLVASLFSEANCGLFSSEQKSGFADERDRIISASRRFSIGGKSLFQYLHFGFGQLKNCKEDLNRKQHLWRGRNRPQALVLAHVDTILEEEHGWQIKVKDGWDVFLPSTITLTKLKGAYSLSKGPILVAMIISPVSDENNDEFGVTRCFAAPVVNGQGFMVVSSDRERTFAKIAIKCILEKKMGAKLKKPLFSIEIEAEKVIADFLVKHGNLETAFMIEKSETALSEYETPPNINKLFSLYPSVERINYTSKTSNADFYCRSKAIIEKVLDELCLK